MIVLDPVYSTHDQDENNSGPIASPCLLRLRDVSCAGLIVVHHMRKSVSHHEIGGVFRGSSVLQAVGDSYMLLARPSPQLSNVDA